MHWENIETRNLSVRWTDMETSCHRDSSFEWDKRMNGPRSWIARQKDNSYNRVNGKKSRNMGCGEERERYRWTFYIRATARESAGRRGTDDIEPNAPNKANVMELMTGCAPLTLVMFARTISPCTFGFSLRIIYGEQTVAFLASTFRVNKNIKGRQTIKDEIIFE